MEQQSEEGELLMYHFVASGLAECWAPPECRWMSAALFCTTSQPSWVQPQTHSWTAGRKQGKNVIRTTCSEMTGSSQKGLAFKVLKGPMFFRDSKCKSFSQWFGSARVEKAKKFLIYWPLVSDTFHQRVFSSLQKNGHIEGFPAKHKSRWYYWGKCCWCQHRHAFHSFCVPSAIIKWTQTAAHLKTAST